MSGSVTQALCAVARSAAPVASSQFDQLAAQYNVSPAKLAQFKLAAASMFAAMCGVDTAASSSGSPFNATRQPAAGGEGKPCCSACAQGNACGCSVDAAPDDNCDIFPGVSDNEQPGAYFPDGTAPIPSSSSGAAGWPADFNCRTVASDINRQMANKIAKNRRRFNVTADTTGGLVAVTSPAFDLDTPAGKTWYRMTIDPIGLSHVACPRELELVAVGGAAVTIDDVAIQVEKIYRDGNGNIVRAWDDAIPEDPDYIEMKDGHCACAQLCGGVPEGSMFAVSVLATTKPVGTEYSLNVKGKRSCFGKVIGPCPPDLLGNREQI